MEKEQKRRRRSIRNIRRRSNIIGEPLELENEEPEKVNPDEETVYGSLWMETVEPAVKKKKRRSSLFNFNSHHLTEFVNQDNVTDNSSEKTGDRVNETRDDNFKNVHGANRTESIKPPDDRLAKLTKTMPHTAGEKHISTQNDYDNCRKGDSQTMWDDLAIQNTVENEVDRNSSLAQPGDIHRLLNDSNEKQTKKSFSGPCQKHVISKDLSTENCELPEDKHCSEDLKSKQIKEMGLNTPPTVIVNSPDDYKNYPIYPGGDDVVTPPNVLFKKTTPPSMSPEYPESPRENRFTNSHDESYLTPDNTDSDRFQMNKENSLKIENTNTNANLSQDGENTGNVKEETAVGKTVGVESISPSYFSITKAIGKVVEFVKTSPSYIFGYDNPSNKSSENLSASPVLKSNQANNIAPSPNKSSNIVFVANNDPAKSVKRPTEKVSESPSKDFFADTFNAVLKALETPKEKRSVKEADKPSTSKNKVKAVMSMNQKDKIESSAISTENTDCKQGNSSVDKPVSIDQVSELSSCAINIDKTSTITTDPNVTTKLVQQSETKFNTTLCSDKNDKFIQESERKTNTVNETTDKFKERTEAFDNTEVCSNTISEFGYGLETVVNSNMSSDGKTQLIHSPETMVKAQEYSVIKDESVHESDGKVNSKDTFDDTNVKDISINEVGVLEQFYHKTVFDGECLNNLQTEGLKSEDNKTVSDSAGDKMTEKNTKLAKFKNVGRPRKRGRRSVEKTTLKKVPEAEETITSTISDSVSTFTDTTEQTDFHTLPKQSKGDRRKGRRSENIDTLRSEIEMFRESNIPESDMSADSSVNDNDSQSDVNMSNGSCIQSIDSQSEEKINNNQLDIKTSRRSRRRSAEAAILKMEEISEVSDKEDKVKVEKPSRKRKYEMDESEIEKIYRNKNYVKPEDNRPWQTIYENPNKSGESLSKKRMSRFIDFDKQTQMKLRRRKLKALKCGWNVGSKKRVALNDEVVKEKLDKLWSDLDDSNPESPSLEKSLRLIVETE